MQWYIKCNLTRLLQLFFLGTAGAARIEGVILASTDFEFFAQLLFFLMVAVGSTILLTETDAGVFHTQSDRQRRRNTFIASVLIIAPALFQIFLFM